MNDKGFSLGVQHKIFNNEIRKRREALGLSQEKFSLNCGISKYKIGLLENFRIYPSEEEADVIAKALNTTPEILFPEWLKLYKPKVTKVVTEHLITEPLLTAGNAPFLLTDFTEVEDEIDQQLLKENINKKLTTLTDRQRRVVELRYGLSEEAKNYLLELKRKGKENELEANAGGLSYKEVGEIIGVSRERIRQIEDHAFRRLRHHSRKVKKLL